MTLPVNFLRDAQQLIPAERRDSLKPEFKVEGLLRTDSAARSRFRCSCARRL